MQDDPKSQHRWWRSREDKGEQEVKETSLEPSSPKARRESWLERRQKAKEIKEQQLTLLQDGYFELVDAVGSIRDFMAEQQNTQRQMAESLNALPRAAEGLKEIGQATEKHVVALESIRTQLSSFAERDEKVVGILSDFSNRASESENQLIELLKRSEKRLMIFIVALIMLTLLVLGAGVYWGWMQHLETLRVNRPAQHTPGPILGSIPALSSKPAIGEIVSEIKAVEGLDTHPPPENQDNAPPDSDESI